MANKILMVTYDNQLHKCHLPDHEKKEMIIGNSWSDNITFSNLEQTHKLMWNGNEAFIGEAKLEKQLSLPEADLLLELYLLHREETRFYDAAGAETITVGTHSYDDIMLPNSSVDFVLHRQENGFTFQLENNGATIFHNFKAVEKQAVVCPGDQLFVAGTMFCVGEKELQVMTSHPDFTSKLVELVEVTTPYSGEYPDYHRSPRIIYREPEEDRTIAKPAHKPSKPSEQLARTIVPPIVMVVALIVISLIQPRGVYIIVMLSITIVTIIFSITSYVKSVKKYKADMKHREETYKAYLQRKTKELHLVSEEQRHALFYHYPDIVTIRDMVRNMEARIYEKTMYQHDFLHFRAGLGTVSSSFKIDFNDEEFTQEKDELIDQARELLSQYKEIENVPVVTSLTKGPVGYIGHRPLVLEQLQLLVTQLALFHSYHDVQFIIIFPEEEKQEWDWMRWLPHASLRDVNVRGFIYHERSRDQVLYSLYQLLKERRQTIEEKTNKNEKLYFSPHYIVLITDEKMILDHIIMEFFNEDLSEIGVSLVFVQDVMQALPEHVKTVIDIRDAKHGNILLEEGELVNKKFHLDHYPEGFDKEEITRALAPVNHLQNLKNSIPEKVTFLEMYDVENVTDLNIEHRWKVNETYKSLAVPLGLRGKEDIVQLNLHEKAHGPHGLVAGTTGSGKSEIIQSYILSLGINFHPYEVAFLLIDYKGGGMANLFHDMPHLLGTITNLDKAQSMRALASIKAELQKRQRLFGEHNVNHINQYQKLYKQGKASEAMPHLFLISDEFAELKSEQPDFMKELVSTARIGRSLGIHLILATQKPSGVVDDQIWSNSKFKLALKVQNASDSNEILKTPDAAEITLPGRAYLQVGNNEIYELFQSAWSGADYVPDNEDHEFIDTTVYAINDLGQYDILTEDLSGLANKQDVEKKPTELEAVIDYIATYTEKCQIDPLPRPWLPPLPERILPKEIHDVHFKEVWQEESKKSLVVTLGLLDQPELQSQSPLTLDLTKHGHIAVFSSPGYGKSTFLQTVTMNLVHQHHPEHLHVYLLDFGTNGLLPLKTLPHVADTMLLDEEEKVAKFIRLMSSKIKERKQKLSNYGVASMDMYEKASGDIVENQLIVIDNYDSVRDAAFSDEFEKLITQIAREGASIGIHLAISAGRQSAMRMPLLSNIKTQIPLYLIEETEARGIVGRTEIEIEEIPGRGMIKLDEPALFQTMLPAEGEETLAIIDAIQATAKEMEAFWDGELPEEIPMMPEGVVDFEKFKNNRKTKQLVKGMQVPLGLEFEEVQPLAFDPIQHGHLTVVSDRQDGLDRLRQSLAKNVSLLSGFYQTMLIDTAEQQLSDIGKSLHAYISEKEGVISVKNDLMTEINIRTKQTTGENVRWLVLIADVKDFCDRTQLEVDEITLLIEQGKKAGIHFIFIGDYSYIGLSFEQVAKYIRSQAIVGLMSMRLGDQDIFKQPFIRQEKYPNPFECYLAMDHQHTKLKIPE
ncbi:type VII secretion protein EssC [Virgibacillus dokdonensis]|uniref:ESX-1 secretion system protein EccCa1 n=1 Tax=Virgibacillus dokdonensis TaxID=302167 RepID=A0A2K9J6J6_9BACI|nr:type VII secretion protein EssC [Virgibacillus dokdonensis]AUJ26913.1 ESX-1 secretion system protein EccCa1 [Virgibacillus dokdonensis]